MVLAWASDICSLQTIFMANSSFHKSEQDAKRKQVIKDDRSPEKTKKKSSPAGFEPTRPKARPNFIAGPRVNHSTKVTCASQFIA